MTLICYIYVAVKTYYACAYGYTYAICEKNDSEASLDSVAGALILLDFSHTVFVFNIIFKIKKHGRHKRKSATTPKKTY